MEPQNIVPRIIQTALYRPAEMPHFHLYLQIQHYLH